MKHEYGIIFDCDGTLVDSLGQAFGSFNFALDQIGEKPRSIDAVKRFFGRSADKIFFAILQDEAKAKTAFEFYMDHQAELAKTTQLHAGIRDLLTILRQEQVPMAIVTGRHELDLDVVLKPHAIADDFVALVADSHLPKPKPAPDGLLLAAERMGLEPANTLYVGDSLIDVQAAHAAGGVAVAALWDQHVKPEEMKQERPAFMAQTPADVWTFFKSRLI
jgi:HAD superfamily hydrolase (TIGR01509 family)